MELSDQILVGVLGESSALVSVQEHIVNVQRGSDQRLVVGNGGRVVGMCFLTSEFSEFSDFPRLGEGGGALNNRGRGSK